MAEYIEREAALSAVDCGNLHKGIVDALQENIKDIPAADVVEVRRDGKKILDVTCGNRQIWFQKNEPHTIYCDRRKESFEIETHNGGIKRLNINPDVVCNFTNLPFENDQFSLVVFDPPHIENLSSASLLRKEYGSLEGDWKPMIRKGFEECMRVLKPGGVLVFKWSDISVSTREIINVIGTEPLFGHRSGKKMNTHWMCFMKFADEMDGGVNDEAD